MKCSTTSAIRRVLAILVATLVVFGASPALAENSPFAGERVVTVMTQNVYFGADLAPLLGASTPGEFTAAAANAYLMALDSDFEGRASAIADSIAAHEPMLIGIQEATVWSTGPFLDPAPADTVTVDLVALIIDELAQRDLGYTAVVTAHGFDAEVPAYNGIFLGDVRLQIADVILARSDLRTGQLKIEGTETGRYQTLASIPLPTGQVLPFYRQWAAVDVKTHGKQFRFVTTHLEVLDQGIRTLQANELIAEASGSRPTIFVGDFNDAVGEGGAADLLDSSGLTEVWPTVNPGQIGATAGQAADLRNETSLLTRRIDMVFASSGWQPISAVVVGEEPDDKTASGLWPSDHAGVVATLRLER